MVTLTTMPTPNPITAPTAIAAPVLMRSPDHPIRDGWEPRSVASRAAGLRVGADTLPQWLRSPQVRVRYEPRGTLHSANGLLPDPSVFERFPPLEKALNSDDFAAADQEVERELLVELDMARAALQLHAAHPEHGVS